MTKCYHSEKPEAAADGADPSDESVKEQEEAQRDDRVGEHLPGAPGGREKT